MSDNNKPFSSGFIAETKNTLPLTKEDIRLDQIIPPDIFKDKTRLKNFLESYYEFNNIEAFKIFKKNAKFSNQNRASGGLLEASWVSDLEKATSQLSLEKKIIFVSFFVTFLAQSEFKA